jgi:D-alanyl-D-alanine carboxypeptidase (penicillin-binding protein 5/6)
MEFAPIMKRPVSALLLASVMILPARAATPPFDTPAPIAFMEDITSGAVLYAKDADRRIPPASMAKMMTVYVAFDMIAKGELKLDQKFTVRPETWKRWHGPAAGSTMFLSVNEQVSVANLLYGIITLSGNDACVVLAEGVSGTEQAFTQRMNDAAKRLGLANSHFGTSNGWPDGGVTYVTARDLAALATATIQNHRALYKQFYSRPDFTWGKTMGGADIKQDNRDPLLGRVAGADGLKTGHTEEAGFGFTGSAEQNGRRLVMVIAGLTSFNQRIEESVRFMDWGFRAWAVKPIAPKGKKIETAEVQLGASSRVGLIAPRDLNIVVPGGTNPEVQLRVVYDGPIKAPITAGQHIADLVVTTPDMQPQHLPLVAEKDVPVAGFFGRAWAGFWSLFGM